MPSNTRYSPAMRTLHWLCAAGIIGLLAVGFYMANIDPDAPDKYALYPTHKAFGMLILLLVLIRIPVRLRGQHPPANPTLLNWEKALSHTVHMGLYMAMIGMTVSGYFMNSTYAYVEGINMFGLFTVPDITAKSEFWNGIAHTVHSTTAWAFVILLALHIGGALKHRFLDHPEADVLGRMI